MSAVELPAIANTSITDVCRAFAVPDRILASSQETELLKRGRRQWIVVNGVNLAYWTFGKGPRVLLMHGWGSRGSHLLIYASSLVASGFSVTLFDAPAHGESGGLVCSMVHAGRTALSLAAHIGGIDSVIAHSGGSTAALWAFANGLSVKCSVHLCGPVSLTQAVEGIAIGTKLDKQQTLDFAEWVERLIGMQLTSLDLPALSAGLSHPGLIIHDNDDRVVDVNHSIELHHAWPKSYLKIIQGSGHRKILADRAAIAAAVEFLKHELL
jgi:pimeloyl-ACP methyl ester carboxylesterase